MRRSSVLAIRDFKVLFCGRLFYSMALQALDVMVGWHVYALSKDPLMLGMIGLAEAIPAIGFSFVAGHVVDNRRPNLIYRISLIAIFLNTVMVWMSTWSAISMLPSTRLIILFLSVFISGLVRSFGGPSTFALVSHIVPRSMMAQAAAWNSWTFQMASIVGPAVGGLVYGLTGAQTAFAIPPLLMVISCLSLFYFSSEVKSVQSKGRNEPFLTSVGAGIAFTFKQKTLLSAMVLDMFSVLFGGATAMLPMFSDQVLHSGSTALGFLRAASSLGSGLVAMSLAFRPLRTISGTVLLVVVAGFGASIIGFALSTQFFIAFVFLMFSGAFDGISMVIRNTILQLLTPEGMRGRVSSLSSIFITSSNEIGAFESGLAAKFMGLIPSLVFGGLMTLGVVAVTTWLSPELRKTRIRPGDAN